MWTLQKTFGVSDPLSLMKRMRSLSLRSAYRDVTIPILAVNGDSDTLVSTQDTVDLAHHAPLGDLILYPDDDHCAMGHYDEVAADSTGFLAHHLGCD
ncbi:hypothetical protein nbrc107696_34610 [Gordonia spumicola]|uniref:Alpha/beta hydrolase n=2 Tax=Gordonia spumicola TaxID=589161 RepID=A0A7I9VCD2_9ACTN|nr:hypothetical protein nbrc107696_34610 [Gordonia spumicola]